MTEKNEIFGELAEVFKVLMTDLWPHETSEMIIEKSKLVELNKLAMSGVLNESLQSRLTDYLSSIPGYDVDLTSEETMRHHGFVSSYFVRSVRQSIFNA